MLLVGEGPGFWENQTHRPFVGKTGRELDQLYLVGLTGFSRASVKVANAVCCWFDGENQTKEQARECANANLRWQVQRERMPYLTHVVLMGAVACSILEWAAVDAERGAKVAVPNLLEEHGLAVNSGRDVELFGRRVKVFATIHPAAGLHSPSAMNDIVDDFVNLRRWRLEGWTGPLDQFGENLRYGEIRDGDRGRFSWDHPRGADYITVDTELDAKRRPWCAQFSVAAGTGWMIRADQPESLRRLQQAIYDAPAVHIHNAKFDIPVLMRMGVHIPLDKLVDTMLLASALGLPQGLKTLARRLCGMKMQSWEDIVGEQFEKDCIAWVLQAEAIVAAEAERAAAQMAEAVLAIADAETPDGIKWRRNAVSARRKELWAEIEEAGRDWWRPPLERYVDKNGDGKRRRGVAWEKRLALMITQHLKSKEAGGDGVKFAERWWGDEDKDDKPGLMVKMPLWALKLIKSGCGEFPGMGLDLAPYEQALHYSCRDVDALARVGPLLLEEAERRNVTWSK